MRAVIEGVSFSQRDCLSIIESLGVDMATVRLSGGGAKSPFWRQMLADVFNLRVAMLENTEGSAYGAGLLAMAGSGAFASVEEACAACIRETSETLPKPHESHAYQRGYEVYSVLYPALKPIFGLIHPFA